MDLTFTPEQDAFRAEAREWLRANVASEPLPSFDTREGFDAHREWERALADARWSVVNWPAEFGGRDADLMRWLIFEEEYWAASAPGRVNQNGIFLLAPVLLEYGTEEQKARYLPPIARSDEVWCQGWSEPNSGTATTGCSADRRRGARGARSRTGCSASSAPSPVPNATAA
jgi:alkylation response protein AidB-like acyl-CoA dehydrogenase